MNQRALLQQNFDDVSGRIADAAIRSGRTGADIQLIAVTKYVDADVVSDMLDIGMSRFGESRPQVLWEKYEALSDLPIEWHLIGHLQRNKVKRSLPMVSMIHSVDSLRLLTEIDRESNALGRVTRVLLEVNISGDDTKHGLDADGVESVCNASFAMDGVDVCGLMGMGGLTSSESETRKQFAGLRKLRDRVEETIADSSNKLPFLSMGMSGDFELAIEEGATHVRIGSILVKGLS